MSAITLCKEDPFAREPNGLVNLESYLPYLVDPPEVAPVVLPFNNQGEWVHQHVYFQEATYRQVGVSPEEKDMNLVWMRHISYNQVIMKRHMELKLHQMHERDVVPPPSETVASCLRDYEHLDMIGAAIVGKAVTLDPESQHKFAPGGGNPAMSFELSPTERVNFFENEFETHLDAIRQPLVIPERIVTSVLKKMSVLLGDERLKREAEERLKEDRVYYPLRMPKTAKLYHIGNEIIYQAFAEQVAA